MTLNIGGTVMQKVSIKEKKKDVLSGRDETEKLLLWKYDNGSWASLFYNPKTKRSSNLKTYPNRYSMESVPFLGKLWHEIKFTTQED